MERTARGYFICAGLWAMMLAIGIFTERWNWIHLFAIAAFLILGMVRLGVEKGKLSERTDKIVLGLVLAAAILIFLFVCMVRN